MTLACAGYQGYDGHQRYVGPLAVPGPNGVPLETPEVAAAKGAHLAALSAAGGHVGYAGSYGAGAPYYASAAPITHYIATPAPGITFGGAPLDTPEVAAAKAAHFAAYSEAASRNAPHYRRRRSAGSYYGGAGGYGYAGPQHIPIITDRGVPLDTPEVQAAKAYHAQAYVQAAQKAALSGPGESGDEYQGSKWYGPIHIPVIGPNGVPVEPQEVQQARAAHLSALGGGHVSPLGYSGSYYGSPYQPAQIGYNGLPLDTPEVQAAKAAHFAAYSKAYGHAY